MLFDKKVDFAVLVSVTNANPNGDPLNGNRPRTDYKGFGEMSDVCIKRKLRNRMQDMGHAVFVQSDDRADDGCISLKERAGALKKSNFRRSLPARPAKSGWTCAPSARCSPSRISAARPWACGVRCPSTRR